MPVLTGHQEPTRGTNMETTPSGTFTITVEPGNQAFEDPSELGRVLARIADRIGDGRPGPVSDTNGNAVATWNFRPDPTDVDLADVETLPEALERAGITWNTATQPVVPPVHRTAAKTDPDGTSWLVTLRGPDVRTLHVDYWTGSRVEDVPTGPDVVASVLLDWTYVTEDPMDASQLITTDDYRAIRDRTDWIRDVFGNGFDRLVELAHAHDQ